MAGLVKQPRRRPPTATEIFRRFLKEKGLRATAARTAILNAVSAWPDHFDVEELFLTLRRRGLAVSKASVYRTLPLLVEAGLIKEIYFEDGHLHYESIHGREHHCHLRCVACRKVIEFQTDLWPHIERHLAAAHGFLIQGHRIEVYGLCPECRAGEAEES